LLHGVLDAQHTGGWQANDGGREWCCWGGLNSRPHPYQGCALPLSYSSRTMKVPRRLSPCGRRAPLAFGRPLVKRARARQAGGMSDETPGPTREERLAAKLRENLRRRKTQARELDRKDDTL